jgi:hypothetical protein
VRRRAVRTADRTCDIVLCPPPPRSRRCAPGQRFEAARGLVRASSGNA